MDVAALSVAMHQGKLQQEVGFAVMKKAMESAKANTDALITNLEQSVNPNVGRNIDLKI